MPPHLEVQANLGYVRRTTETTALSSIYEGAGSSPTNPYGFIGDPASVFSRTSSEQVDRFIVGGRAEWRALSWLRARAALGLDLTTATRHSLERRGESCRPHRKMYAVRGYAALRLAEDLCGLSAARTDRLHTGLRSTARHGRGTGTRTGRP